MRIFPLSSLLLALTLFVSAHADTITFASTAGSTTYTYGYGYGSLTGTGGITVASTATYSSLLPGSQWVSTSGGGGDGTRAVTNYTNSFNLLAGHSYTGTISFLADDYGGVLVNNVEVFAISGSTGYSTPTTINLLASYFRPGANTISIEAYNTGGPGGADFAGSLTGTVTPEPSSLLLLGTGVLGALALARRRFRAT